MSENMAVKRARKDTKTRRPVQRSGSHPQGEQLSSDSIDWDRKAFTSDTSASFPSANKIAIPRLRREVDGQSEAPTSVSGEKTRVIHACEPCRSRKTKCSGDRPICKHCKNLNLLCIYAEGKRDRARRQVDDMMEKLFEYEDLLKEATTKVDASLQERIVQALFREDCLDIKPPLAPRVSETLSQKLDNVQQSHEPHGEHLCTARLGSLEPLGHVEEDFDRDTASRSTGYQGKVSEVTWMQRLKELTEASGGEIGFTDDEYARHPSVFPRDSSRLPPISDSTYRCDDLPILFPDGHVDPYERPEKQVADAIFRSYLETVHPTFPIIGQTTFTQQYQNFFYQDVGPSDTWLAILNTILAIGAKFAHLIKAEWKGNEQDHLIYFNRACELGLKPNALMGHAELQRVQLYGLMAFYLKACYQINRSWLLSSLAFRHASALGLNLRDESPNTQPFYKELRYRVWWALSSLEHELAVMTGRSTSYMAKDCTVPLPTPADESDILSSQLPHSFPTNNIAQHGQSVGDLGRSASSDYLFKPLDHSRLQQPFSMEPLTGFKLNNGLYFHHYIGLSRLVNQALDRLYRAEVAQTTWTEIQKRMMDLNRELFEWQQKLPKIFDFAQQTKRSVLSRHQMCLGISYYSTKIVICRPCLGNINKKVPHQTRLAQTFNLSTAMTCVQAACDMLGLLPDEPGTSFELYHLPWWCLLHHLIQAAVICMVELSLYCKHMPDKVNAIFTAASKAAKWIRSISTGDLAAERATRFVHEILQKLVHRNDIGSSKLLLVRRKSIGQTFQSDPVHHINSLQSEAYVGQPPALLLSNSLEHHEDVNLDFIAISGCQVDSRQETVDEFSRRFLHHF